MPVKEEAGTGSGGDQVPAAERLAKPTFLVICSIDTADVISCHLRVDLPQAAAFEMQQPSTGARMPVAALGAP